MLPALLKKYAVYAGRIGLGMLILLGLLTWLAGTESALHWCTQQAVRLSNGQLNLGAVHGSLYGPLRVEAISFQTDEKRFEVKEVNLDWTPASLLGMHVQINRLTVQELKIIDLKSSAESARFPDSLHSPVTFTAPAISVDRLVLMKAGAEHVLSGIDLGVENSKRRYKLNLRSMATEWGQGEAEVVLDDARPFGISAHASLRQEEHIPYRIEADASGSLEQLQLKAAANASGGQAAINATLNPFNDAPLVTALITAKGVNPARLRKDFPQANLSADISVTRQGAENLVGNLMIRNDLPGPWNHARLPLREMRIKFDGTPDLIYLRVVHLDIAKAGVFNGDGQIRDQHLRLDLSTTNFNPAGVLSKINHMQLVGNIAAEVGENKQRVIVNLQDRKVKVYVHASHQNSVIELRSATVKAGDGSLAIHGSLALDGPEQFQMAGELKQLNPAEFGDYPVARINAAFSGSGRLVVVPYVTLGFSVTDSQFRQQPLSGQGRLKLSKKRIWDSDVIMQLADNRIKLQGGLGNSGDRLTFNVSADNLAELNSDLSGKVHATGLMEGDFAAPSGHLDAQVSDLSWQKNYRIDNLQASASLGNGSNGQLDMEATLQGVSTPELHLDQAGLSAHGTRIKHTLQLKAKNPDFDVDSQFVGGWKNATGWSGLVKELSNRGHHAFTLQSPAKLEVAREHFLLNEAEVNFTEGNLILHEINYTAGQFSSHGEFQGLPLAYLQGISKQAVGLQTDISLNGEWQFAVRDKIDGHIAIWRDHGDIFLPNEPGSTLGLNSLIMNVVALNNQLQGRFEASGTRLGNLMADAQCKLSSRDGVWGITGDSPVAANVDLSIESLAWLNPLIDSTGALAFDGAIKAELHAGGAFMQPQLEGNITGDRFTVALQNQGIRFTDGRFEVGLKDQVVQLKHLTLRGGDGNLNGHGSLTLNGESPVMQLSMNAEKLEVLSRPDRYLVLSGTGNLDATSQSMQIAAQLKADWGLIELPRGDEPTPSADVVIVNLPKPNEKNSLPYALNFDLDLDLGEHFTVKAQGLDARLGGALKIIRKNGAMPSSRGSIRVVRGNYLAYGQSLKIERGILNFQGPLNNPGLDIIALRKNQPVEAGIAISGTVQSPRVKLVSNPSVPDGEKLSWLVLGHGIQDSSGQDFNSLEAAAGVLLSVGESVTLQQNIAHESGLDEFSLKGSGKLNGTVIAMGKRLSSRAYLSYEQGFTGNSNLVTINYMLTQRLSVQAQAGNTPAMDLFYTFEFD